MSSPTPTTPTPADDTPVDLEAIEKYVNAATAGPWDEYCNTVSDGYRRNHEDVRSRHFPESRVCKDCTPEDMRFISRARTDMPALIAEVKRLREQRDRPPTVTDEMVTRFLMWPLPPSVCADLCTTDTRYAHGRIGTMLLTAIEARQMLEYVLKK